MSKPWPEVAIEHSRLLRPFPTRRLSEALYHVEQEAGSLHNLLQEALVDPPATAEAWRDLLDRLDGSLESLSARCGDARPVLARMAETADMDHRRAVDAMTRILQGMSAADQTEAA